MSRFFNGSNAEEARKAVLQIQQIVVDVRKQVEANVQAFHTAFESWRSKTLHAIGDIEARQGKLLGECSDLEERLRSSSSRLNEMETQLGRLGERRRILSGILRAEEFAADRTSRGNVAQRTDAAKRP